MNEAPPIEVVKRLVMVDDDALGLRTYSVALRRLGWEVETYDDAQAALKRLNDGELHVLLTDLNMPGIAGDQLVAAARAAHPDAAILVMSGQQEITTAVELISQGADDYLAKPMRASDIDFRLTRAMERRALQLAHRTQYHALRQQVAAQAERLESVYTTGLVTLARTLDLRDPYTHGHSTRVASLTADLAQYLGFDAERIEEIRLGGLLHDMGKLAISDEILLKPGRLTEDEMTTMAQHPVTGYDLLQPMLADRPIVLAIVRSHHERMNGTGYPDQLAGPDIPVEAMMVALADSFDAMTSDRPYRAGMDPEKALGIIEREGGTHYEAGLTSAFAALIRGRWAQGLNAFGEPLQAKTPA